MIRAVILLCLMAGPLAAQDDLATLAERAAAQLDTAQKALVVANNARNRVDALTAVVKGYEDGLIAIRSGLRDVTAQKQALETDLSAKSTEIGQLLGVLQTIGRTPAPVMLLHPGGPVGTARSGMIVADVTPALQSEVTELRAQMTMLADLQELEHSAEQTLNAGLIGAQEARAALSIAIQTRQDLPARFVEDQVQTALLLASTDTLDAFAGGLANMVASGLPNDATLAAKGSLPLPVTGKILRRFNEADAAGVARPGVIVAGPPSGLVQAPTSGTILFRGPLLDYGNVVILEPSADIMFVFAGLGQVYGEVGQIIPAGAPLGLLAAAPAESDANLNGNAQTGGGVMSQTLYLEVRDGQTPVNPATWFALEQKVEEQ